MGIKDKFQADESLRALKVLLLGRQVE